MNWSAFIVLALVLSVLADPQSREERRREREEQRKQREKERESSGGSSRSETPKSEPRGPKMDRDVVVLEDGNFDENVFKSKDSWFIEFYAPWCGHCKKLEPEWFNVARSLKGEVKVAKVDATVHTRLGQRFGIQGYPTIKFIPAGSTRDSDAQPYEGGRDAAQLTAWAREQGQKYKPIEIKQLVQQQDFEESCVQFQGVCVVVFLPHIYDSNAKERNQYIDVIKQVATNLKGRPLNYLWAQGGDNYEFEEAFQSGSAYPSVMALSVKKNVFAKLKGVFSKDSFENFLKGVLNGKEGFQPVRNTPQIKTVSAWDGKDHTPPRSNDDDL